MLRHLKFLFLYACYGIFFYQNFFFVICAYFKSLIKKVSMSLRCPYCYLLLFIKNIVVVGVSRGYTDHHQGRGHP